MIAFRLYECLFPFYHCVDENIYIYIFFFFFNIGFTLDSSMIEIVFICPFEFCELFYKYNSSLGMAVLFFPQLHSSLDLVAGFAFHP